MSITNYDELKQDLRASGGVKVYHMRDLREAHGAAKLGTNVVQNIKTQLSNHGLGSFPYDLPPDQWSSVRIYEVNSGVGSLLEAAYDVSDDSDIKLKSLVDTEEREAAIQKIKELVSDL